MSDTNSESRRRERQLSLHTHVRDHDQPASQLREPLHRPRHVVVVDPTTTTLCASSAIVEAIAPRCQPALVLRARAAAWTASTIAT